MLPWMGLRSIWMHGNPACAPCQLLDPLSKKASASAVSWALYIMRILARWGVVPTCSLVDGGDGRSREGCSRDESDCPYRPRGW